MISYTNSHNKEIVIRNQISTNNIMLLILLTIISYLCLVAFAEMVFRGGNPPPQFQDFILKILTRSQYLKLKLSLSIKDYYLWFW